MIKRKGFTLIEIISAVAIIGIIIAIAVVAYSNTADRSLKRLYEAKIKLIEIEAENWASDNNITDPMIITVNRLIVEGYMDSEKESEEYAGGIIESPVDKTILNCKLINIELEKGNVRAEYTESENCEIIETSENDARLGLKATGTTETGESNGIEIEATQAGVLPWERQNIILSINPDYEYDETSVKWYLKKGLINGTEGQSSYKVESNYLFDSIVRVSVNVIGEKGEYERRTAYLRVRIDFEEPEITDLSSTGSGSWVNDEAGAKIEIKASDLGSGMNKYYYSKDNGEYEEAICIRENPKSCEFNVIETGSYKVKATDKVGNESAVSNSLDIKVDKSELKEPEVTLNTSDGGTNESGKWTNKCVSFKLETESSASGIGRWEYKVGSGSWKAYTNSGSNPYVTPQICEDQNQIYCFRGINNAGTVSKETCVDVKIDRTKPTTPVITNTSNGNWVNVNIVISATTNASISGVNRWQESYDGLNWQDIAGSGGKNQITMPTYTTDQQYTLYLRVIDNAGNISDYANTPIKLDKTSPTAPAISNTSGGNWTNQNVIVGATTNSSISGTSYWEQSPNGSSWSKIGGSDGQTGITMPVYVPDQDIYLYLRVRDNAGNISPISSTRIRIDKTAPVLTINPTYYSIFLGTDYSMLTGVGYHDGVGSGIASFTVSAYNANVFGVGNHVITYTLVDNLGHVTVGYRNLNIYHTETRYSVEDVWSASWQETCQSSGGVACPPGYYTGAPGTCCTYFWNCIRPGWPCCVYPDGGDGSIDGVCHGGWGGWYTGTCSGRSNCREATCLANSPQGSCYQ